jgi:hypothetical protein
MIKTIPPTYPKSEVVNWRLGVRNPLKDEYIAALPRLDSMTSENPLFQGNL